MPEKAVWVIIIVDDSFNFWKLPLQQQPFKTSGKAGAQADDFRKQAE